MWQVQSVWVDEESEMDPRRNRQTHFFSRACPTFLARLPRTKLQTGRRITIATHDAQYNGRVTMSSGGQHDRVQRELDELRQKHLTAQRRDKMKDSK